MKTLFGIFLCMASLNVSSGGMEDFEKMIEKRLNLGTYTMKQLSDPRMKIQTGMIYNLLTSTQELNIHQMNGAKGNTVFLHKDGHKEAVYDTSGKLVSECLNKGSYNYQHGSGHG